MLPFHIRMTLLLQCTQVAEIHRYWERQPYRKQQWLLHMTLELPIVFLYFGPLCTPSKQFLVYQFSTFQIILIQINRIREGAVAANITSGGGGGRTRLPKFKFSAKFPVGLHELLQLQLKHSKLPNILWTKLFQPKIRWSWTLNSSWNNLKWVLFMNNTVKVCCMQRSVLPNWIELFLPPLLTFPEKKEYFI